MNSQLEFRLMTPADIASVASWVATTPLWQRYGVSEDSMSRRFREALAQGATIYVAGRADSPVGFVWLVERGAFDRSGYVQLIGVRPDLRNHGIGQALMEFAEERVLSKGRDLFLLVSDFNTDAQRFYHRLGYQPVGRLEDYVVPGVCELIYLKKHGGKR